MRAASLNLVSSPCFHTRQLGGGNNNPTESAYSGAIASIRIMNEDFIEGGSCDRSSCAAQSPENVPRVTMGSMTRVGVSDSVSAEVHVVA